MIIHVELTRNRNATFAVAAAAHPLLIDQKAELNKCGSSSNRSINCQFAVIAICVNSKANKTLGLPHDQWQLWRLETKELSNELAKIGAKLLPEPASIYLAFVFWSRTKPEPVVHYAAWQSGNRQKQLHKRKSLRCFFFFASTYTYICFSLSLCVDIGGAPAGKCCSKRAHRLALAIAVVRCWPAACSSSAMVNQKLSAAGQLRFTLTPRRGKPDSVTDSDCRLTNLPRCWIYYMLLPCCQPHLWPLFVVALFVIPAQFYFNSSQFNVNILCRFACRQHITNHFPCVIFFFFVNSRNKFKFS